LPIDMRSDVIRSLSTLATILRRCFAAFSACSSSFFSWAADMALLTLLGAEAVSKIRRQAIRINFREDCNHNGQPDWFLVACGPFWAIGFPLEILLRAGGERFPPVETVEHRALLPCCVRFAERRKVAQGNIRTSKEAEEWTEGSI
jgi:hypothetical protein